MTKQIKHLRTSKFGKKFVAGSKIEIEREPEEYENIFDKDEEVEIPQEDVEKIREETGADDEKILVKIAELGTNNVSQIIDALKED